MAPAWGHVHFWGRLLHPSSALLICLTAIVVIQFLGYAGLGLVFLLLLTGIRGLLPGWWKLLRRAMVRQGVLVDVPLLASFPEGDT